MNNDNAEPPVFDEVLEETAEVEDSKFEVDENKTVPESQPYRSPTQIAAEVHAGKWGEPEDRDKNLEEAGHNVELINLLVERGVGKNK